MHEFLFRKSGNISVELIFQKNCEYNLTSWRFYTAAKHPNDTRLIKSQKREQQPK